MKKVMISLFCIIFAVFIFAVPASALSRVADNAGMLSEEEKISLAESIDGISEKYGFDVVIVTVSDTGNKTATQYADDYFDYNGYGFGDDRSGILLLISSADREYWISTSGSCIRTFTDSRINEIGSAMLPKLSSNDYYGACSTFLSMTESYLAKGGADGTSSVDINTSDIAVLEIIVVAIAALIGFLFENSMKKNMKPPVAQSYASNYVMRDSFALTESSDVFLYTSLSKTPRPKQTGRYGGSSTHVGSSGRSHGGGGGRF